MKIKTTISTSHTNTTIRITEEELMEKKLGLIYLLYTRKIKIHIYMENSQNFQFIKGN